MQLQRCGTWYFTLLVPEAYSILVVVLAIFTSANEVIFSSLFVCLSVCLLATLRKNFGMDLHKIFRAGCQWPIEQMIKFWWQSGSLSGYMDCFPDSSLLGDTEWLMDILSY